MTARAAEGFYDRIPKVELHLHLEGAIPLEALWALVEKYDARATVPDVAALARLFEYESFSHFLETWMYKNGFLRQYEDFAFVAEAVARDLARQNVRYAEAFFSPADFVRRGLDPRRIAEAVRQGLSRVPAVRVALIADLVRDYGPERGRALLEALAEVRGLGLVGIGIGGSEREFPPEPFAPVFERARSLGLRTTAHAGEAAGPESVWGALIALRVDRIGHGTRAIEDARLVDELARRRIPLEVCPISNVRTKVVPRLRDHPVRRFYDRGLRVTINTDDPAMFQTSLAGEYRALEVELAFRRDDVRRLVLEGIEASWLPDDDKRELAGSFAADPDWQG